MNKNEKNLTHRICSRMVICMAILAAIGFGTVTRLFIEQVIHHDKNVASAQEQSQIERNLQSPRGMILDRNGKVLAISEMSKSLYADPTMLNEDPAMVADLLAPYLRISKDEIERRLKEDTAFVWLDRQMDHEKYEAVESLIKEDKLHGLAFRDENRRFYPNGSMAAQVIGFVGENGRGSHEYCDVMGRVDIITGTLGKALGGASGGYTAARKEVVEWLRQRSRPYLFSNSLAPAIVAASIKVLEMVEEGADLRDRLWANARLFREKMTAAGFTLAGADHAIIPVMLGEAVVAQNFARELQKEGIYVTGFFYPVVPKGQARIRTQMSAAHTPEQITRAVEAFTRIGKQLGVIA